MENTNNNIPVKNRSALGTQGTSNLFFYVYSHGKFAKLVSKLGYLYTKYT